MLAVSIAATLAGGLILPPSGWHLGDPRPLSDAPALAITALPPNAAGDRLVAVSRPGPGPGATAQVSILARARPGVPLETVQKFTIDTGHVLSIVVRDLDGVPGDDILISTEGGTHLLAARPRGGFEAPRRLPGAGGMATGIPADLHGAPAGALTWQHGSAHFHAAVSRGPVSLPVGVPTRPLPPLGQGWRPLALGVDLSSQGAPRLIAATDEPRASWQPPASRIHFWDPDIEGGWATAPAHSAVVSCGPSGWGNPVIQLLTAPLLSAAAPDVLSISIQCIHVLPATSPGVYGPSMALSRGTASTESLRGALVADIDGDGLPDVIAVDRLRAVSVWRRAAAGGFHPVEGFAGSIAYPNSQVAQALAIVDATGNGCPDVVLAGDTSGLIVREGLNCTQQETTTPINWFD